MGDRAPSERRPRDSRRPANRYAGGRLKDSVRLKKRAGVVEVGKRDGSPGSVSLGGGQRPFQVSTPPALRGEAAGLGGLRDDSSGRGSQPLPRQHRLGCPCLRREVPATRRIGEASGDRRPGPESGRRFLIRVGTTGAPLDLKRSGAGSVAIRPRIEPR